MYLWLVGGLKSSNSSLTLLFADEAYRCIKTWQRSKNQNQNQNQPTNQKEKPQTFLWSFHYPSLSSYITFTKNSSLNENKGSCKGQSSSEDPMPEPSEASLHKKHSMICWETYCKSYIIFLWMFLLCKLHLCY